MSLVQEFKAFILRGNIVDLAVAFILGAAFTAIVTSLSQGVIMALVAALVGEANFDDVVWHVGDGVVAIGTFLTALVNFLIVAAVLFLILKAVARAQHAFDRRGKEPSVEAPAPSDEVVLLTEIRDLLRTGPRP